jgi:ABC-2 type transport system permease protein
LLSGSLFPLSGASGWIRWVMRLNPLTYGTEALRTLLFPASPAQFSLGFSLLILAVFATVMFLLAFVIANRRSTRPAA